MAALHRAALEAVVRRRESKWRRAILLFGLLCVTVLGLFACAMIFVPMNPRVSVFHKVAVATLVFGGGTVAFWVIATFISIDLLVTRRQLSDLSDGLALADWWAGQGVYVGLCGLVHENVYTPWQGVWDFRLSSVRFDADIATTEFPNSSGESSSGESSAAKVLEFVFVRRSKGGVERRKSIAVDVTADCHAEAESLRDRLNAALAADTESIDLWLRRQQVEETVRPDRTA